MTATDGLDLNQVTAFVRVMEAGSFTAAAHTLGLPKSSVSRRVSALEKALRVRLLQRGARKLVLTEAGRLYYERTRAALAGIVDAGATVTQMSKQVAGPIRFTSGADNTGLLANLISEFLATYPQVQLEVVLTPRRVDLVGEGFDLALRAGPLLDSSLVVRRLGRSDHGLFAARAYLARAGKPQRVSDLAGHRFVLLGPAQDRTPRTPLHLIGPDGEETVRVAGPLVVHDVPFAADAIAAGVGIGLIPEAYFGWAARGGGRSPRDLVRVLPAYRVIGSDVSLVSPPTAYEPARVGLLRDFLADRLRPLMQACSEESERGRKAPAAE